MVLWKVDKFHIKKKTEHLPESILSISVEFYV